MTLNARVLYLLTSSLSANTFGVHQIKALSQNGFEVHLICGPGKLNPDIIKFTTSVYICPYLTRSVSPIKDIISLVHLLKLIARLRPKILIYATPKSALLGAVGSFLARTPIRVYQVWGVRWQNLSGIHRTLLRKADFVAITLSTKIVVVSKSILSFLTQEYKINRMVVLGSGSTTGIDTSIFYPRRFSSTTKPSIIIGYAGRLNNEKGISDLYNLFCKLIPQLPNLNLEIIGDLDLEDELPTTLVTALKSHSNILWLPHISPPELAKHMRDWDLQIFLSKREGLGNVILEAGACGVPTICWDILGTRDAIPEFLQNHLIPYNDMSRLEKTVVEYLLAPLDVNKKIDLSNWYFDKFDQERVIFNFIKFIVASLEEVNE